MKKFKAKKVKDLSKVTGGGLGDKWHTTAPGGGWWYWDYNLKDPVIADRLP